MDLTLDRKGAYAPARGKQPVAVARNEVYLHNRSGARKSSGSYYTKPFAVEHLLEGALEPALDDHFDRLSNLDDTDAAEAFFDFRVADIAMGSGHFLIGAIDRIERRMADWLAGRPLPGVRKDLASLREAVRTELGDATRGVDIEDGQLLRRLIARRCIYGVDLNGLSVQLARLAVWIHTFVPGLPLSFLDRNLVHGNALVGVGNIDEIEKHFQKVSGAIFAGDPESLLGAAKQPLRRLANVNDATMDDVKEARKAAQEARCAISTTEALCDLIAAQPVSDDPRVTGFNFQNWEQPAADPETFAAAEAAKQALMHTHALHFPIAFPEVFLRERPGFDVILGNPPWQEATVEEHAFWARHFPGLRGLPQREQEAEKARLRKERPDLAAALETERQEMFLVRKALIGGAYPGMGTGDPDLYKAFCWRFWHLTAAHGGRVGVVLPRGALNAKGSMKFRQTVFDRSKRLDIVVLQNRKGWVFDDVTPQYTIGLVCIAHGMAEDNPIRLRGPFASLAEFRHGVEQPAACFDRRDVLDWNDTASLPLLPDSESIAVFARLRKAPRLDLKIGGGGGWHGAPARIAKWTPRNRKRSCPSNCRTRMAHKAGHRTPRDGAETADDVRGRRSIRRLLAGLQGGVLQHLESRYRHLLRMGRPPAGA